jgi:diacylglycerol kinase family enzyme
MRLSLLCQRLTTQGDELRVLLMHNPSAGDEEHGRETLVSALEVAGHEVIWHSTKESDWEALAEGVELVVAAGGDGTVRKVFRQLAGKDVPATILPVGTANNIARSLGFVEADPVRNVRGWSGGRVVSYDIATLTSSGGEASFVESAGAGLFADALARAENDSQEASDKVEQGLRMLLASIAACRPRPWTLELDGDRLNGELVGLEVMNVSEAGPRISLAPAADPCDGALEVVPIRTEDVDGLRTYAEARLAGASLEPPTFEMRRTVETTFELPPGCPVHVDDQLLNDCGYAAGPQVVSAHAAAQVKVLLPSPA